MPHSLRSLIAEKVVVFDGAMGTSLQAFDLTPDDFGGLDGCNEILVETRPDVVLGVHDAYLAAGADVVQTNTFGGSQVVLAEYGIADRAYRLALQAAKLAREAASGRSTPDRPRFVYGSVGPGTKLPSLGHITFRELKSAYRPLLDGLLDGGVDAIVVETIQDLLQAKAVLDALGEALSGRNGHRPLVMASVTIEATGTMLVGADIAAAVAALWPMGVDSLGLNCATGPEAMKRHVQFLGRSGPALLSVMPNAGLPRQEGGRAVYPLTPEDFARWLEGFVREDGVGIVGGCCGTTPEHIRALAERVGGLAAPRREATHRRPETASLYQAVSLVQEPAPMIVGERTNANGSREFRDRLLADDLEGMVAVARHQEDGGAHMLDVCVAYVGRDERADMERLVPELARQVRMPLAIDSTDPASIEAALERHGGRCLINSINLEDGEERLGRIVTLARRFGAAVVALVIDEQGMTLTRERKLEVAERIHHLCTETHGLAPEDLVFDLLTFTVGSGDPEMRRAALETLEAIPELKRRLPGVHTLLGVSNVSFGLAPAARRVLNSVFLAEAVARGLDMAIINARGITPLHRIPPDLQDVCRRLIHADWSAGDPLTELMARHAEAAETREQVVEADLLPRERLQRMVVNGEKKGLEALLDALLADGEKPLDLVNQLLIPAMQEVGVLFGSGQMQLPFVLQSAEVMKAAVRHLEPHLERGAATGRGTMVLATVKGDVHDIGKNLVDIIVSNNGFRVVNLGIKAPIEKILEAAAEHRADAIGMSGLLVKSTLVMKENLEEMVRRGIGTPVLLGGAALTRQYVERDLRAIFGDKVHYGEDAFEGLRILTAICGGEGEAAAAVPTAAVPAVAAAGAAGASAADASTAMAAAGASRFGEAASSGPAAPTMAAQAVEADPLSRPRQEWPRQIDVGAASEADRTAERAAAGASATAPAAGAGEAPAAPRHEPIARGPVPSPAPPRRIDAGPPVFTGSEGGGDELPPPPVDLTVPIPKPPWWGTRVVEEIPLDEIYPLLNETTLFRGQWRYRRGTLSREDYAALIEREVRPAFERLKRLCRDERILQPRGVFGYFPCHREGRVVVVHDPESGAEAARFPFPRRLSEPHWCVADFFRPGPGGEPDLIGMFVVTIGEEASRREKELFEAGEYRDYLHLHGLSVEAAEAAAEWLHARMRKKLGISGEDREGLQAIVTQGYRGSRYSFGYPACPELESQEPLFGLLRPERIGVRLTENYQMQPEQSVSAIVVHHPQAKYFSIS